MLSNDSINQGAGADRSYGERGVFIVIGALWMSALLMISALAIDTYMLANAKLQQGNTVDAMSLSALRSLLDPPVGAAPPTPGYLGDSETYNFVIERAALLAQSPLIATNSAQASASQLYVHESSPSEDEDEYCSGIGGGGGSEPGGEGEGCGVKAINCHQSGDKARWCGFEGASPVGDVIFGSYDPATKAFSTAAQGEVTNVNAVYVRLSLQGEEISPMVFPMMKMIMGHGNLMFSSRSLAYRDPTGKYRLVPVP